MADDPSITIVGIGPGDPRSRTLVVQDVLDSAETIILRTSIHPGIEDLLNDTRVVACDDIYKTANSFDEAYDAITQRVIEQAKKGAVTFVVPGSPAFGERTVDLIRRRAMAEGIPVRALSAVSSLDMVALTAGFDLLSDQPQLIDALDLIASVEGEPFSGSQAQLDPSRHLVISQVYDRRTASECKHALSRVYPETHQVVVVRGLGTSAITIAGMPLSELDHVDHDHLTTVVVHPVPWLEAVASPQTLFRIIGMLRSPEGCPWDRKQTHASLADKVIEEAHEVAEAIAQGDPDDLRDELGDLLLLVSLHAQIAEEAGDFTIEDVFRAVNAKLIRRHPHVFGDVVAETPEEVLTTWKRVKAEEKSVDSPSTPKTLRYDQLPRTMSVIERIRRAEGDVLTGAGDNAIEIGTQLLALIESALDAGIDPEASLELAYRTARQNTET